MRFYIQRLLTTAFITLALISASSAGENIMEITGGNVDAQDTITIQIKIQNEDDFTAFQSDIQLPDQLSYLENSALINTDRSQDHQLQVSLSDDDVLSVFGFSVNNNLFTGDTGSVASFKLVAGTIPGSYTLALQEAIIGGFDDEGNSVNILTSSQNGSVTLLAPEITLSTDSISFGEVPLETTEQRNLIIQNQGNEPLQIDSIIPDNSWFTTNQTYPLTINAGGSTSITVTFNSQVDDTYHNVLKIYSNDPDENQKDVILYVYAFAVNELHCGDINAFSGDTATLTFSVNNMEAFTGFQFDLQLPDEFTYVENSEALTERKTDHAVNVSYINGNEIRAIAYSANNENFTGEDGDILTINFYVDGTGGYYPINMNEVIIADNLGENVLSDFYNGSLQIAAADISVSNSMDFGMVSILDTASQNLSVYNYGQDTLEVGNLIFSSNHFFTEHATSFEVLPGQSEPIEVFFADGDEEVVNANLTINSNDPDESPKSVALSAETYIPNTMSVDTLIMETNDTAYVDLNITNYEDFVGFQVDIDFPNNIAECYLDSIQLTGRADDHVLSSSMLDTNTVRIFAYSMSNAVFSGSDGPVLEIPFISDSITGQAPLELSENIIANEDSENILYFSENGFIEVNYQLHEITLSEGWNWFSLNASADYMSLDSLLMDIADEGDYIKSQTAYADYYQGFGWFGSLNELNTNETFLYKKTEEDTLRYRGNLIDLNTQIEVVSGWNWISYLPTTAAEVDTALYALELNEGDYLKNQTSYTNYYDGFGWFGSLTTMTPNEGYMLKINQGGMIDYPEISIDSKNILSGIQVNNDKIKFKEYFLNPHHYEFNGSITASVFSNNVQIGDVGDKLLAFHKSQLIGITSAKKAELNHQFLFPLMLFSDADILKNITFKYYDLSSDNIYDIVENATFKNNMIKGDIHNPYILNLRSLNELNDPLVLPEENEIRVFPNPCSEYLNIITGKSVSFKLLIINSKGQIVLNSNSHTSFNQTEKINVSNLSKGLYTIKIFIKDYFITKKMIIN